MKIVRYEDDNAIHYGRLDQDRVYKLAGAGLDDLSDTGDSQRLDDVRLLAPVLPPRVFGVGLNYVEHIKESNAPTPEIPLLFVKPSTSVIGPDSPIVYPLEAQNVHFEAELAVVIGRRCRRVSVAQSLDYVFGYTCANDVSERVIQAQEMAQGALLVSKGYDTFCPLGPVIETELDPSNLAIGARVNGEQRQASNTADLLFSVADLVSYLSTSMTLLPGDVIITGTPSGVGPIVPGDRVEIYIEGIGALVNEVVAES